MAPVARLAEIDLAYLLTEASEQEEKDPRVAGTLAQRVS